MKKIFFVLLVLSALSFAKDVQIHRGWNLVGATNDLDPATIHSADSVWTYRDNNWTLYYKNAPIDNFGFNRLNSIRSGEGFWVNAANDDTIHFADIFTQSTVYNAYGLWLIYKKKDERYTVSNSYGTNSIDYDAANSTFMLNAYKNPNQDSRTELNIMNLWTYPITEVETTVTLTIDGDDTTGFRNRAQLNLCNIPITQTKDASGCTGIIAGTNGIYVWYEKDYLNGQYVDLGGKKIGNENMVDKTFTMKISIDGTKINFSISGDVSYDSYIDTADTNATIYAGARHVAVRARVKGNNVDPDSIADATHVLVKNIAVTYE